jgi:prepilin-type N-terminal cleavage/methylation domain-containing protein
MRPDNHGFTLVELMVVVAILGLLAGMVVPVLSGVLILGKISATNSQMGGLDVALNSYSDAFHGFPPSNPTRVAACADGAVGSSYSASGAENLFFFLTGWYMNGATVIQGQKYVTTDLGGLKKETAPFYMPSKDEWVLSTDSYYGFSSPASRGKFIGDKFDKKRPILYFKADTNTTATNPFTESDNSLPLAKWKASSPSTFNSFVVKNGIPRSTNFVLWSAGPNERFFDDDDIIH